MINFKSKVKYVLIVSLILVFSGCTDKPVNLTQAKNRVIEYYESGEYERDVRRIVRRTIRHFEKIERKEGDTVIFDIDETLLSSYLDQKSISFGYIPKLSHEWIMECDAPVISEVKRLYNYLLSDGYTIILMTGRKHNEYDATVKNLENHSITGFERLIVRSIEEAKIKAIDYKSNRRKQLTKEGYRIVCTIGDQWSDLNGGFSGKKVKLPNYTYEIP